MKTSVITLTLVGLLLMLSCLIIYRSRNVINNFKTKDSLLKKLGAPDEERTSAGIQEWLYEYDIAALPTNYPIERYHNPNTVNVVNFNVYRRYLIFTMDIRGNVLHWKSEGLNFPKINPEATQTIASITIVMGLVIFLFYFTNNLLPRVVKH